MKHVWTEVTWIHHHQSSIGWADATDAITEAHTSLVARYVAVDGYAARIPIWMCVPPNLRIAMNLTNNMKSSEQEIDVYLAFSIIVLQPLARRFRNNVSGRFTMVLIDIHISRVALLSCLQFTPAMSICQCCPAFRVSERFMSG